MNLLVEQELRRQIASCQQQLNQLRSELEVTAGSALATTIALHGLIAAMPDLDLAQRALDAVRKDFSGTADPASAERAMAFVQTFDALQTTVAGRKDIAARRDRAPQQN